MQPAGEDAPTVDPVDVDLTDTAATEAFDLHAATLLLQQFLQLSDQFTKRLSGELSVNATDFKAMEHLLRAGPLTPGELARRLGISGAAMTTSVDRLVSRGHVNREPNAADRRSIRVVPAPASMKRADDIVTPMVRGLDAEMDGFSSAEQQAITKYLEQIVATMRAHASPPDTDSPASAD